MRVTTDVQTITLGPVVGGGQTIGRLPDGRKVFVWGGLPGEVAEIQVTKRKNSYAEAVVTNIVAPSEYRIPAEDEESYLSTSPWQIYSFEAEEASKVSLIEQAFALHKVELPGRRVFFGTRLAFGTLRYQIGVDTTPSGSGSCIARAVRLLACSRRDRRQDAARMVPNA